ncbi:lipopolysaccharide transport periplasmic protein LptA [Roseibacterium beibuensis]|uniref:LptA/OstA family protein n=1 Tax=[Roseibacterium] beibuensis TaxID=1193142 RepID=A0ABP9LDK9_9RHOB|nr:LptA/OstA family protein [Roseibacterium beibuensis]MCS6623083.1 lipopolysaccharide transport periplasmic protein LptA [Roseibacterium beibuensis]
MRKLLICGILGLCLAAGLPGMTLAQVEVGFGGVAYDPDQPVEVTADGLTLDQTTGEAVFSGNVLVVQGDLRMAAGQVRILYSDQTGRNEVREVVATGGVLVTRGADAAEGSEARYDVETAMLTMRGNVLVTQGTTAVAGDRMVVNMRTGNGSVDGRVRTVLDTGGSE